MKTSRTCTTGGIGRSSYIRNLTGAILVGVALTISGGQGVAAETDPCATDAAPSQAIDARGVPFFFGVNVTPSDGWTYELPYEQGRPIQMETSDAGCEESIASVQATEDLVSRLCTSFHDVGGAPYLDEACAEIVRAAAGEAQGWPNFDSTSIAIQAGGTGVATTEQESPPSFSLTNNGRSILLSESKEAPGQVASTGQLATTGSMMICYSCGAVR